MSVHFAIVSVVGDEISDVMSVLQATTELFGISPDVEIETLETGQQSATAAYALKDEDGTAI